MIQDPSTSSVSVTLSMIARCVEDVMTDLARDCTILCGESSCEFLNLMRRHECHRVCPHEWSDEVRDLEKFHSMNVCHCANMKESCNSQMEHVCHLIKT